MAKVDGEEDLEDILRSLWIGPELLDLGSIFKPVGGREHIDNLREIL